MEFLAHPGHSFLHLEWLAIGIGPLVFGAYLWVRAKFSRTRPAADA